jgi:hypothetical protein
LPARLPPVPRPELEALRLAVHHPEAVAGRLHLPLFGSELARAAFSELAGADTLHQAVDNAAPPVADLLGQLAVVDSQEQPDDVLRRLVEQCASRALAELRREAKSSAPSSTHEQLAQRTAALQIGLQALRSVDPGPEYELRLEAAERGLVELLLESPENAPSP